MQMTISILGADGAVKAQAQGDAAVQLVYAAPYEEGDRIQLTSNSAGYVAALLEDSMAQTFGYLNGVFTLLVPFGEKRVSYSPKSFVGTIHLLWARAATEEEITARRNLALNPLDSHHNTGFFPHAFANVETRGESVFAARNAIDGCYANDSHGPWPYQSWGINRQEDAALTVEFDRQVCLDQITITLRADFPHDNWWRHVALHFSDGTELCPELTKTGAPQTIALEPRTVTWVRLDGLIKDETDPSPFPALTQIEAWGKNKI